MYCAGLDLRVLGSFEDHQGFDGVMLGCTGLNYHFELTHNKNHPVAPRPTQEDLAVFYVPDQGEWQSACARMVMAGFRLVASFNPYWDVSGRSYEDPDGYRVVLQNADWKNLKIDLP